MKQRTLVIALFFIAGALAWSAALTDLIRGVGFHLSTGAAGTLFLALGESYRRRSTHRPASS